MPRGTNTLVGSADVFSIKQNISQCVVRMVIISVPNVPKSGWLLYQNILRILTRCPHKSSGVLYVNSTEVEKFVIQGNNTSDSADMVWN